MEHIWYSGSRSWKISHCDDMTGKCRTAENYLKTIKGAMQSMGIGESHQVLALTMDNLTVMQAFWRLFQNEFEWVLV